MDRLKEDGEGVPANAMGSSSSTAGTGGIDTYDPLLKMKKKPLRSILKRKTLENVENVRNK